MFGKKNGWKMVSCLAISTVFCACQTGEVEIVPVPITAEWFPTDSSAIEQWIHEQDIGKIRRHGWMIWSALTAPTDNIVDGHVLPVWETWYSTWEVFNTSDDTANNRKLRGLKTPNQAHVTGLFDRQHSTIFAFNKYDPVSTNFIRENGFVRQKTLADLNESWPEGTPIAKRKIADFPRRSVVIKPVFWLVKRTGLSVIPYWTTPYSSTNDSIPAPHTWKQSLAVDPTGELSGTRQTVTYNDSTYQNIEVIDMNEHFYAITMHADEIDFMKKEIEAHEIRLNGEPPQAGDFAILVAMHVTTKETELWTWQTFYWAREPDRRGDPGSGTDRPDDGSIVPPWDNYIMADAYFMVTPPNDPGGTPYVAYNPYLETTLRSAYGVQSNCMSCHLTAVWPADSLFKLDPDGNYPVFSGYVSRSDSIFADMTQLDAMWGLFFNSTGDAQ